MWKLGTAAVIVVALAAAGFSGIVKVDFNGNHHPLTAKKPTPDQTFIGKGERAPREFLYLDNTRSEAYLSQLHGGNEKLQTISDRVSAKVGAEVGVGPVKATGEAGRENAIETSVSPTASSNFQAMVSRLDDLDLFKNLGSAPEGGDRVAKAVRTGCAPGVLPIDDGRFARNWCGVHESAMVTFVARLHKPLFVQAYLKLRWAEQHARLRKAGKDLLRLLGEQPRLPLAIAMGAHGFRMIMPVQTALLSTEPTLFSPRLRVVAKVVRRIDRHPYDALGFYARFDRMLWHRYAPARRRLGIDTNRLRAELEAYRAVQPPAALLLPVAIFN